LVVNLLKNAFEALETDTEYRQVSLSTVYQLNNKEKPEICLAIADTGSGIPEDVLPSLFEPYVSSKQTGSGLGLSIVKKIVEEHSARVIAKNNEQHGATISIYFPVEAGGELNQGQSLEVKHVT
jgi:nitrogen fixation/metabolism regulation signal transduction histidine kinase